MLMVSVSQELRNGTLRKVPLGSTVWLSPRWYDMNGLGWLDRVGLGISFQDDIFIPMFSSGARMLKDRHTWIVKWNVYVLCTVSLVWHCKTSKLLGWRFNIPRVNAPHEHGGRCHFRGHSAGVLQLRSTTLTKVDTSSPRFKRRRDHTSQ
jgi:hypothetical protein